MRRTLLSLALCGALLSSSALSSSAAAQAAPEPPNGQLFHYGGHPRQDITVYGDGGTPLVIVHGGYWSKDTDWSGWARWFAARGFTVYDTDYRLTSDAVWPAQRDDVLAALHWVRLREGGRRPLVLGSSAGGHLALQAGAYGAGRARALGVVALSPVASPLRAWRDGARPGASAERRELRRAAVRLAGCVPGDGAGRACRARWTDLSVASHASGADDAPLLLVHSAGDFVPRTHATEVASAERGAGLGDITVRTVSGSAHGGPLLRGPGMAQSVLRWLRSHP
ncbi:alpha/beta hydrolase family protein [Streptomyces venezuelae]|uniref:alpha/beta hydrolase family protein n=1 Tax=Streptomyces venezuelae TaxID=54571 RepID=UPI00365F6182